jgi:hypothetical protein
MRNIPVELVTRYEEAGWWTRDPWAGAGRWVARRSGRGVSGVFASAAMVGDVPRRASGCAEPRIFINADEFAPTIFQPDLCFGIDQIGLVRRDFDDALADQPMTGTVAADFAGTTLIALISGTARASRD